VRVIEVLALGARRGPAEEARRLYRDIPEGGAEKAPDGEGGGRRNAALQAVPCGRG
jgi:hypothetical protein